MDREDRQGYSNREKRDTMLQREVFINREMGENERPISVVLELFIGDLYLYNCGKRVFIFISFYLPCLSSIHSPNLLVYPSIHPSIGPPSI